MNMNSPKHVTASSPTFKNLKLTPKQSPVELKEKMRKNYKDKVQNCRHLLLNRFRGTTEADVRDTLTEIYKSIFNFSVQHELDGEESDILEEIQRELVQEEVDWWVQEYERSQLDNVDWSALEQDTNVICLICQKDNFRITNGKLSCPRCKIHIPTYQTLTDIRQNVGSCINKHSQSCDGDVQFAVISDVNDKHIYLICQNCSEMCLTV